MNTEYEVKFLNVDIEDIRIRLKNADAKLVNPMTLMRRTIFENPELKANNAFIRVRDEGNKITLTYKVHADETLGGAKEIEVEVSDYEPTVDIFKNLNIGLKSTQESKRETWELDECEIVIDQWPWLNPYIEIEGSGEDAIKSVASKLNLNWSEAKFGDVMVAYRDQYKFLKENDTIATIKSVRFDDELPDLLKRQ